MGDRAARHGIGAACCLSGLLLTAAPAHADTIDFGLPVDDVRVQAIGGGEIVFLRQGQRLTRSLENIEAIYFDDLPALREAERLRMRGDEAGALAQYELALANAGSDVQRLWLHSRLALTHGQAGQPARAVAELARVARYDADSFWLLLVPAVDEMSAAPADLDAARSAIADARAIVETTEANQFLDTLTSVLERIPLRDAEAQDTKDAEPDGTTDAAALRYIDVQARLSADEPAEALRLVQQLALDAPHEDLPELYHQAGEALRLLNEPALAGLSYARCAAHYPESAWATRSLLALARLYDEIFEKPHIALRLARRALVSPAARAEEALRREAEEVAARYESRLNGEGL